MQIFVGGSCTATPPSTGAAFFVVTGGFSPVMAGWGLLFSCSVWASHCSGFSHRRAQALELTGSVVVAHGLGNPAACGI